NQVHPIIELAIKPTPIIQTTNPLAKNSINYQSQPSLQHLTNYRARPFSQVFNQLSIPVGPNQLINYQNKPNHSNSISCLTNYQTQQSKLNLLLTVQAHH